MRFCGAFALDATGRFRAEGQLPGRYRLRWYRGAASADALLHADEVEVAPGKTRSREFHFTKD